MYAKWTAPTCIVVDGPYGVGGFPGDPPTVDPLPEWYAPHVAAWAKHSLPSTTLWFWGTELGWATVHPILQLHGWDYRSCHVWDKGVGHIAGNVNGNSIRRFPVVTEVCVQYVRRVELITGEGETLPMQQWLRKEWQRSGLPLSKTNQAAGVKNAATRKWFTHDHLWYYPPPEAMETLAFYACRHGKATEHPYFSLDGTSHLTAEQWERMRAKWTHEHAITNVWREPPVRGAERLKSKGSKSLHSNQKPLRLIEWTLRASTSSGDVVWDPFAGLATVAITALQHDRKYCGAEINRDVYESACARLKEINAQVTKDAADERSKRPRRAA
jgi:site-specific DNA-methyltransferase (adenine-specific)